MRFELDDDQRDFAAALDVAAGRPPTPSRSPAPGPTATHAPGLKLWARLAELGVTSLADRGHARSRSCVAFEALGRHAVPGPWVESAAYLPVALGHEVEGVATVALPPHVPYALDADVADQVYVGSTPRHRRSASRSARSTAPAGSSRSTGDGEPPTEAAFDLRGARRRPRSCSAPASGSSPTR